ncbi:Hypothetical Protein SLY_0200 [Strawberry lethal yellows phytoplasma (CPA) str. NZSb11]|uniref:Uncharacterized protein n=1 Tax=Strawberry lethal yellows phytoplasma (CPA) str. NZSb11 TaxID=980422 RepID=R4S047_PHYAS|nr:Hypothetical Protein SLY_0200 [Strawberry lethal yellows phytoplasma (CPA) str. NZSb11]
MEKQESCCLKNTINDKNRSKKLNQKNNSLK